MLERYQILSKDDNIKYIKECPIILYVQALVKDTRENKVLAQIKFQNISNKSIKALYINIECKNIIGEQIESINNFPYLDLLVKPNNKFAEKVPVYLPNAETRTFEVIINKIIFEDNDIWENADQNHFIPVEKPCIIKTDNFYGLANQFKLDYYQLSKKNAEFIPIFKEDYWLCTCKTYNILEKCINCNVKKLDLENICQEEILIEHNRIFTIEQKKINEEKKKIEEERQIEEERLKKDIKNKKKKFRKKLISVCGSLLVLMILCMFIFINVIKPYSEYKQACELINAEDYVNAKTILENLGDYKDSKERLDEIISSFSNYKASTSSNPFEYIKKGMSKDDIIAIFGIDYESNVDSTVYYTCNEFWGMKGELYLCFSSDDTFQNGTWTADPTIQTSNDLLNEMINYYNTKYGDMDYQYEGYYSWMLSDSNSGHITIIKNSELKIRYSP